MSYQVLARKWRPTTFSEVIGQELAVKTLCNSLDNQRLHHAYLFTGTRGTGKTTLARIFAKAINCDEGIRSKPCQQCNACQSISDGNFIDLIEIDAASRTGIEDTKELLENVRYQPTTGRFKVYIIDEVHMLSNSSFNALLKTLEEPPEHIKFLLATTDPQKLPVTVLSRCIQLHLINIKPAFIAKLLTKILEKEEIQFEPEAATQISHAADGSMRDALSLTDQLIAQTNSNITAKAVSAMLGTFDKGKIESLLELILQNESKQCFDLLEHIDNKAPDYISILKEICSLLHNLALVLEFPKLKTPLSDKILKKSTISHTDIQVLYQMCTISRKQITLAPSMRGGFEMLLLRMLHYLSLGDKDQKKK